MPGHTAQDIHQELWNDPVNYHGSQDSLQPYVDSLNAIRDSSDPRPITINIRTPDKVAPGVVSEPLYSQFIRDAISTTEYNSNCEPTAGDDQVVIGKKETLRDLIAALTSGNPEANIAFTDGLQDQLLSIFTSQDWPDTRAALLALTSRDGSRSEELWGVSTTRAEVDEAHAWGLAQQPPQDLLNKP